MLLPILGIRFAQAQYLFLHNISYYLPRSFFFFLYFLVFVFSALCKRRLNQGILLSIFRGFNLHWLSRSVGSHCCWLFGFLALLFFSFGHVSVRLRPQTWQSTNLRHNNLHLSAATRQSHCHSNKNNWIAA